jgi:hypothetical protein
VGDQRGRPRRHDLQLAGRHPVEQPLAAAEQDRRDVGAQLVDEAGPQVLVDRGRAAGDGDIPVAGAARARVSAASMPSVTKVKVVPPRMVRASRGWWVSTKTGP